ncbi:MarR family winged helix-turn-helix transcriptional regulator [Rhodococcus sp. NPDC078407]|uniref:MarR family winged helix-turn-helix transcriptional regulator n=1 Tax=Rhodococcus sp. NPDC078407 TaxID=3364509 RepID=UPI0037C9A8FD
MTDAVDSFLEQWKRERPTMDASPMGLVGRLSRTSRLVELEIRGYFAGENMEPWEFDVLATLRRSGPPYTLTPKDLVARTMVGSAAMTNRVDRLVTKGLVSRETDPANRRSILITLTAEGHDVVERVVDGHVANAARLVSELEPDERHELERLLRKLLISLGDTGGT